ncbi:MAG: glycerol-3-phosphate 1-O-acyltransferase PlsY [Lachnospiraceae bacterium]|nr:glycerol-3-phosphate 1-O-acyltransferase PlsY [Lachnospiraceae bacterium]
MILLPRLVSVLVGYCFGLFQTSYILGRLHGIDIREHGSGNAGTTNTLRTMGKKAGAMTLLLDILKTMAAMFVVYIIFRNDHPDRILLFEIYAGAGAILGHDFPFYLGFKGGKGIAATAGLVLGLHDPIIILIEAIVFFGIFFTTHYVSLGSLGLYVGLLLCVIVFGQLHINEFKSIAQGELIEIYVIVFLLACLAFYQHRANIVRLMNGTERKTYLGKHKDN